MLTDASDTELTGFIADCAVKAAITRTVVANQREASALYILCSSF
jgi:hypothetical protein